MAVVQGVRAIFLLRRSVVSHHSFGLIQVQFASPIIPRRLYGDTRKSNGTKRLLCPENESLLENLTLMGVDLKLARQRQPGVLRRAFTNERAVAQFLRGKGASDEVIASIISRFPRAITRSIENLEQRWILLRNICETDDEIVNILNRSPESFFRSTDNENLEENIRFLISVGLNTKVLHRLQTTAPRAFSNSLNLNKQMVEFLQDICAELGGRNPEEFARTVISKNVYILIRSVKRVKANIEMLGSSLKLNDSELLALIEGRGARILDLSNAYLKRNLTNLREQLISLGRQNADMTKLIINFPEVLYLKYDTLNTKLDCLIKGGITIMQILEKPSVLSLSKQKITERLKMLHSLNYDFQKNSIYILNESSQRYSAKLEKLQGTFVH